MKRMLLLLLLASLLFAGCDLRAAPVPTWEAALPTANPRPAPTAIPTPLSAASPTAPPAPTPSPAPQEATLGFVGDILIMSSQIAGARTVNGYDFSQSFAPMRAAFASADFLAGNFECTLAGEAAGYTLPRATPPPQTELDPAPKVPFQRFNAPDELAKNLREAGFDLLATANNHCMDKGAEGLYRTARVLREAGLMQLGTFLDPADAAAPRIAVINGICVGFLNATGFLNSGTPSLSTDERAYAVSMLRDTEKLSALAAAARQAGAEFIVAIAHWGVEHEERENAGQRKLADALIAAGADAIIGAHPHVVQPIEWREAVRGGKTVRVPVCYSLGNFISNMAQKNVNYGLYVRLTLTRGAEGEVSCTELAYLPLLCYRDGVHKVKPCFPGDEGAAGKAYDHVQNLMRDEGIVRITQGELPDDVRETAIDQSAQ